MAWDRRAVGDRLQGLFGPETPGQVARRVGVRPREVARWLRGEQLPDPESLVRIRGAYRVSLDWLLTGEGERTLPIDSYARTLGARLRQVRELLQLHPAQLAEQVGLARVGEWEAFERGEVEASLPLLRRLAEAWNLSLPWLQTGEGAPFARVGPPTSWGAQATLKGLLEAGAIDTLYVIEADPPTQVGFVATRQGPPPPRGWRWFILGGQCGWTSGAGRIALLEILCDAWEARETLTLLGLRVPEPVFRDLVAGRSHPAQAVEQGAPFDPLETYTTEAEREGILARRAEARRVQAEVEAARRRGPQETIQAWFQTLPRSEQLDFLATLRANSPQAHTSRDARRTPRRRRQASGAGSAAGRRGVS